MYARRFSLGVGVLLLGLTNLTLQAQEVTADGIRLGRPLLGPEWDRDKLKGQVILLELWGIN